MKRDWELIRKIMLAIEASPCDMQVSSFSIKDYDPEIVGYHIKLLSDALLVEAINSSSDETMYEYYAQDLTFDPRQNIRQCSPLSFFHFGNIVVHIVQVIPSHWLNDGVSDYNRFQYIQIVLY